MKISFNPSNSSKNILDLIKSNKDIIFDLKGHNIFARGVEFKGTDTNTWRNIKINNVSIGSNILDLRNGSNTTLTNTNGVVTINSTWRPVVDNLTSDSTTSSLSANQGRVLAGLINGKSDSNHNHDGRYLRLNGSDTMQGNLNLCSIGTSYIGKGLGDKSGADFTEANIVIRSWWGISFKSNDDIVRTYIDTRTGNIGTKGVLNAVGAVIQGRVYNGGDDEGIIVKPSPNGYAGLILGAHNGERSVFYFTKGNPFWRYNNGSTNLDILHPKKSGTIALTSDIPSSLRNPYSLTLLANGTTLATYDGSVSKIVNLTYDNVGAAAKNHTHNSLEPWASYITGDSHATALKSIFDKNKTSIPRNKFISMYSSAYDNGSCYMGYFINGYNDNPYGGFFVAHYDAAYYIGIFNGSFTQNRLVYSTDIPNSLKNPHALTISLNGTSQGPYDGSASKSINITPGSIGAATSEHNHDNRYLKLTGGTMQLGEGLKFHADDNYFGTNSDARIISLLDGNDKVCDGGLIIDERATLDGKEYITELLRIRDSEFKWKGSNILHSGNSHINGNTITINGSSLTVSKSDHTHDYLVVNRASESTLNSAYHNFLVLFAGGSNGLSGKPSGVDSFGLIRLRAADGYSGQILLANEGSLYIRSGADSSLNNKLAWKQIIDSTTIRSQIVKGAYMTPLTLDIKTLISSGYLASDYTNRHNTEEYIKAAAKYLLKNYPGYSVFGTMTPNSMGFFTANIYGDGFNSNGNPEHITIHYYPHGGNIINCGTTYGSWYYNNINRDGSSYKLQTARKIWGQSFDGTADISGTLSGVAHILFSADNTYNIGSNSAASKYIYTRWLGAKSGLKLELGANNSDFGLGLCIDTNLNVGIGTNTPAYKLDVKGDIRATGQIIRNGSSLGWVNGRKGALLRETTSTGYHTLWSLKTTNGSWDFGEYNSSGWNNIPVLSYITDTNFNSGNNTTTYQIEFPLDSGTIALTKNIPTSLKSPYSLTLKANGTTLAVYDGSSAKEANFTYTNVGAASASHTHTWTSITDKIVAGNEFNIVNAGFNNRMWFNYLPINDRSKTATISYYCFGNGNGGYASVTASGFVKNGSSSSYVLLGDGDHQTISSLSVNYANSAGNADTVDGYHATRGNNKPWGTIPVIHTSGWMDIGKHLEFHFDNTTGSDYSTALMCTGNHGNVVNLPSASGTLALTSDNVASATKLQTARKIWGQSFDGTADVSGDMTDVGIINTILNLKSKSGNASLYLETVTASTDYAHLFVTNKNDKNNVSRPLILQNGYGNVGIGTTAPSYKLHVAGDIYTTTGFKKNGSSDSYVLLGGGGHQTIDSLSVNHASFADYICSGTLPTPANNTVKAYKDSLAKFFNDIHPNVGVGANVNVSESIISHWSNDSATFYNSSTYCFIKIGGAYTGATYGQFLLSSYNLSKVGIVGRNSSQWSKIKWLAYEDQIPTDNNQLANGAGYITSSGSCAYASKAGNADTTDGVHITWAGELTSTNHLVAWEANGSALRDINPAHVSVGNSDKVDGFHATSGNNKPWGTIPAITTGGYMDIGKHLEFHYDNTTGSDYSTILRCTGNYSNIVNLPSASGTLALTSDIPTALPANGGNADTVDGYHASSLVKFYLSPMASDAPADSAKNWFVNTMPSSSGAIVYNVPGSEKTIIAGKSSGAFGHMLQLNYDDTYLRILRYYNGSWKSTNWEKISAGYADSAGSVAWSNITGKPLSLKNPYSLNVFGVAYDGSTAKTVTTSTFVSLLSEGTSTVTDGTMFITSWASDSGFADTNAVNVPYKRKASCLWSYINSKISSKYLPLAGGTMNGNARIGHGSGSLYIGNSGNDGWIYTQDIASLKGTDKWSIRESGAAHFGNVYICTKSDYTTYDSSIIECYGGNNLYLNYYSPIGVNLCNGGGTVQIGSYTTGDTGNNKLYVNGSEFINGASNVKNHVFADGFRHRSHNSNDSVLLAGGGYSQGVPVRYWAIYYMYIGNSSTDVTYTKRSGNYDFITSKDWESEGVVILGISFPSGYNKNNTLIFGNGDHRTSSSWKTPVYVTITTSPQFGLESKIRVMISDDASLNTGFANIYFMCMG